MRLSSDVIPSRKAGFCHVLLTAVVCTSGEHASLTVSEWSNFPSFLPTSCVHCNWWKAGRRLGLRPVIKFVFFSPYQVWYHQQGGGGGRVQGHERPCGWWGPGGDDHHVRVVQAGQVYGITSYWTWNTTHKGQYWSVLKWSDMKVLYSELYGGLDREW